MEMANASNVPFLFFVVSMFFIPIHETLYLLSTNSIMSNVPENSFLTYSGILSGFIPIFSLNEEDFVDVNANITLKISVVKNLIDILTLRIEYAISNLGGENSYVSLLKKESTIMLNVSRETGLFEYMDNKFLFPNLLSFSSLSSTDNIKITYSSMDSSDFFEAIYNISILEVNTFDYQLLLKKPPYKTYTLLIIYRIPVITNQSQFSEIVGTIQMISDISTGAAVIFSGEFFPTVSDGYILVLSSMKLIDTNLEMSSPDPFTWDFIQYYKMIFARDLGRQFGTPIVLLIYNIEVIIVVILSLSIYLLFKKRLKK